jgi:hypothetical protein
VVVHPISTETKLVSRVLDTRTESLLSIGKPERVILVHKRAVDVIDVLGTLTVVEWPVKYHDDAAMYNKAHLSTKGAIETLGQICQRLREELARERDGC